jgi:hypothetical protein
VDVRAQNIVDAVSVKAETFLKLGCLAKLAQSTFLFLPFTFCLHFAAGFSGSLFLPLLHIVEVWWVLGFHPHSHLLASCALGSRASFSLSRLRSCLLHTG